MSERSVVWMEGAPETAVACGNALSAFWQMNGPNGLRATFKGKRMCRVRPIDPSEHPVVAARNCERVLRKRA